MNDLFHLTFPLSARLGNGYGPRPTASEVLIYVRRQRLVAYSDAMNGVIAIVFGVALVAGGIAAWVAIGRARARGGLVASGVNMRTAPPFLLALGVATVIWGVLHLS
jgi:hypothetical protein